MENLSNLIQKIIRLRATGAAQVTLLAACPNSDAVLEAAVKSAAQNRTIMLFAATLNQVDTDGGYTGWTPAAFVSQMKRYARKYDWNGPLYPCLDHGGPWLKDRHTREGLSLDATMDEVKRSLTACLKAGYQLLHIDPTVDRSLPSGEALPTRIIVERTLALIEHAETERRRMGLPPIAYEVGTEEVHGGLVDLRNFEAFLQELRDGLATRDMLEVWPAFIVAQVGTDLHTTFFDPQAASRLYQSVAPLGSLIKGHYSDWVENPEAYPATGMGGANVGPEFTACEYQALERLEAKEKALCRNRGLQPSNFLAALEQAVVDSGRWTKWLQPEEKGLDFKELARERRSWLAQTGARYIWTQPSVLEARRQLYENLSAVMPDPHSVVVDSIASAIDRYVVAFNLFDSTTLFRS